jgi:GrpB-like predicted nucleotidyltransferase (UPF0157 family)
MRPIVVPHDPSWRLLFEEERARLSQLLGVLAIRIEHIGSTSIPGILAKPIIDILIETSSHTALDNHNTGLRSLGYETLGEFGIESRRYFRKSNSNGDRTHHVHAFESGSPHLLRHLAFRDFLIAHPTHARSYSRLKESLAASPGITMDAYIDGKSPFIERTESDAIAWIRSASG